jgi:hypothetical protein
MNTAMTAVIAKPMQRFILVFLDISIIGEFLPDDAL